MLGIQLRVSRVTTRGGESSCPVGEKDGVIAVVVARGVVGGSREITSRKLGRQLGLDLFVRDHGAVVGRRGRDRHLPREASATDDLVGAQ